MEEYCPFIYKTPVRFNERCGKNNCRIMSHQNNCFLQNLPVELQNQILSFMNNFMSLRALSQTCKAFAIISSHHYPKLLEYHQTKNPSEQRFHKFYDISPFKELLLKYDPICQKCHQVKVKDILYPFPTRLCKYCQHQMILTHIQIEKEYLFSSNSGENTKIWNEILRDYELPFFLKRMIDPNSTARKKRDRYHMVKIYFLPDIENLFRILWHVKRI